MAKKPKPITRKKTKKEMFNRCEWDKQYRDKNKAKFKVYRQNYYYKTKLLKLEKLKKLNKITETDYKTKKSVIDEKLVEINKLKNL